MLPCTVMPVDIIVLEFLMVTFSYDHSKHEHGHQWQIGLLKCGTFSCCVNQLDCLLRLTRLAYRNLTLIGSGPTVAARTGNNEYFVGTFLKFGCLIPRNMLTNAANGIKYKCFSVHPHIAWEKNYKSPGQKVNLPGAA